MGRRKIIGYVCESNPFVDKTAWSGLNYKIRESIENAGFEVLWINCRPHGKLAKLCRLWNEWIHGKSTMFNHTKLFYRLRALVMNKSLIEKCDILFFPLGAQVTNFIKCDKPIIYYSDATFQLQCGYYWEPLSKWQYRTGNALEAGAISNSCINIRASHWAAESVVRDYGFQADHTYVLGFGANLDDKEMIPVPHYQGKGRLNILFSGVDWKRKGAEIAIHTVEILKERGIDVHLFLVGIRNIPEAYKDHPLIENVGFLNKSIPSDYQRYIETVKLCHLLLLPTRAECAGIVFSECSAFGIPTYTYDTGGIPDYVQNGENGYRLPLTAGSKEFADLIIETISYEQQAKLHDGCLRAYSERLNWGIWSKGFKELVFKENI